MTEEEFPEPWKKELCGEGCLTGTVTFSLGTELACGGAAERGLVNGYLTFLFLTSVCFGRLSSWSVLEACWWNSLHWFLSTLWFLFYSNGLSPEDPAGSQSARSLLIATWSSGSASQDTVGKGAQWSWRDQAQPGVASISKSRNGRMGCCRLSD